MRFARHALRREHVSRGHIERALLFASATAMPRTLGSIYCAADVLGSLARVTLAGRTTWGETFGQGQAGPAPVGTLAGGYVGRPRAVAVRLAPAALHHRARQRRNEAHADLRVFNGDC